MGIARRVPRRTAVLGEGATSPNRLPNSALAAGIGSGGHAEQKQHQCRLGGQMKIRRSPRRMIFPTGSAIGDPAGSNGWLMRARKSVSLSMSSVTGSMVTRAASPGQAHPVLLGCDHLGAMALRVFLKLCRVLLRIGMMVGKGQCLLHCRQASPASEERAGRPMPAKLAAYRQRLNDADLRARLAANFLARPCAGQARSHPRH